MFDLFPPFHATPQAIGGEREVDSILLSSCSLPSLLTYCVSVDTKMENKFAMANVLLSNVTSHLN